MADMELTNQNFLAPSTYVNKGTLVLAFVVLAAAWYLAPGFATLFEQWQRPEYSHGPLIPVISLFLFLRHLRDVPVRVGEIPGRWPGVVVVGLAILMGAVGRLTGIGDFVAYGIIIWVGGLLLISFGWRTGITFWTAVLHLVYMLPLPGVIYYKMTAFLQLVSSELGVEVLRLFSVPVHLEGNIIDLGDLQLHVAEACSGLRYLFPILSFSYVFAILYTGPKWHKAVLLLAAAPITVVMNSVRIAVAGMIVQHWGVEWVDGFTHFFEGWVIFIISVILLFIIARLLMILHSPKTGMRQPALDLNFDGLGHQLVRVRLIQPSFALITAGVMLTAAAVAFSFSSGRDEQAIEREPFALFPRELSADWRGGIPMTLEPDIAAQLAADDYISIYLSNPEAAAPVDFFVAWYADQGDGGVHSPDVCLPGAGWEIADIQQVDIADQVGWHTAFNINRVVIQKGMVRQLVYFWYDQRGRKVAWDFAAKMWLVWDGIRTGYTDGALVRMTTQIMPGESEAEAQARLDSALTAALEKLPRFLTE